MNSSFSSNHVQFILFFKSSFSSNHPGANHPFLQVILVQFTRVFKSSFSSNHPVAVHPIFQTVLVENSQRGKEFNKFCPPNSSDDFCLFFCIYPSSMVRLDKNLPNMTLGRICSSAEDFLNFILYFPWSFFSVAISIFAFHHYLRLI